MTIRTPMKISQSIPTLEGAGVHLRRAFGFGDTALFDPFLLFDDFRSDHPDQYLKGFPWHPPPRHRDHHLRAGRRCRTWRQPRQPGHDLIGRCTVDDGRQRHHPPGDAEGRREGQDARLPTLVQPAGGRKDVRTALPRRDGGDDPDGNDSRRRCHQDHLRQGRRDGGTGGGYHHRPAVPRHQRAAASEFSHPTRPGDTVVAYVIDGSACFDPGKKQEQGNCSLLIFSDGDRIAVRTASQPVRFLLVSGRPLREPVAWRGPIVMNTEEELQTAFREYHEGTFLKHR